MVASHRQKQFWSNALLFQCNSVKAKNVFKLIVWLIFEGMFQLTSKLIWWKNFQSMIIHWIWYFALNSITVPLLWMIETSCHGAAEESTIKYTGSECKCHCYLKTCLTIFILYIRCDFGTSSDRERNDSVWKLSPWKWNMIRNEEADVHCKKRSVYYNIQGNLVWRWNGLQ